MKAYIFPFMALLLLVGKAYSQASPQFLNVQDAVDRKAIAYDLRGTGGGPTWMAELGAEPGHYGKCMVMRLRNLLDVPLRLQIPNGLMLKSDFEGTQDMVVTEEVIAEIPAGARDTLVLHAMCSEMHDGGPHAKTKYQIGQMSDKNLRSITKVIAQKQEFKLPGQGAVWAYRDKATEWDLRQHGAEASDIRITKFLLEKAGVSTKLHPLNRPKPVKIAVAANPPAHPEADDLLPGASGATSITADESSDSATLAWGLGGLTLALLSAAAGFGIQARNAKRRATA